MGPDQCRRDCEKIAEIPGLTDGSVCPTWVRKGLRFWYYTTLKSGAGPLVGLLEHTKSRTRGSGADEGVRPTFGCGYAAWWGRRFHLPTDFFTHPDAREGQMDLFSILLK